MAIQMAQAHPGEALTEAYVALPGYRDPRGWLPGDEFVHELAATVRRLLGREQKVQAVGETGLMGAAVDADEPVAMPWPSRDGVTNPNLNDAWNFPGAGDWMADTMGRLAQTYKAAVRRDGEDSADARLILDQIGEWENGRVPALDTRNPSFSYKASPDDTSYTIPPVC